MKNILLLATILVSSSLSAGPVVGGGGGAMTSIDNNILIDLSNIVDIRTNYGTTISANDIWISYNQINRQNPINNTAQIWIDFSEKSDISDIQLADGSIIDKWELTNYSESLPMISIGRDTSGAGKYIESTDSGVGRLSPEESAQLIKDLRKLCFKTQSLVSKVSRFKLLSKRK